ncbi:4-hydroxybenzoate octaprenyltransferase [Burkholderiaceae bacterium DAT-1]|nr:4-hydroxybenzoate octaprenyltransferase [Burkholderiaceae bacterium DAT-1]
MNLTTLKTKLNAYERLTRLDKPIGILLLLWPTLWGVWIATSGHPDWLIAWIFVLGTVLMRSAGCVINDWADRKFDGHVERTRHRPLITGEVGGTEALLLAAGLALCALLIALPLNRFALLLTIPAAVIAASYPFFKRFFPVPQAWLGLAFSFGIPMAFAATLNNIPPVAWVLMAANLCWTIAYDTEYAMVDKPDDLKIGMKTSAITFGERDAEWVMFFHALFLIGLGICGYLLRSGPLWYAGMLIAAFLIALQYKHIRGRDRQNCFRAFLDNNYVGMTVFIAVAADRTLHIQW